MKISNHIFDMSKRILDLSPNVHINMAILGDVAKKMSDSPMVEKQVDDHKLAKVIGLDSSEAQAIILKELVSDSVNYCYWQFSSDYRPNGAGSTKMRSLLEQSFNAEIAMRSNLNFESQIREFYRAMMINRFPLMDKRLQHLTALTRPITMIGATNQNAFHSNECVGRLITRMICEEYSFEHVFDFLETEIDGYGDDPFLKRASLFFLQLNRILGLYPDECKLLPIPADYQVPKMLYFYGILEYAPVLEHKVMTSQHLEENGPEEMAIRAGAVVAGFELAIRTGWSPADVDGWFFSRRNEPKNLPFHLCITSNY